ncbi:MAG: hypothetical protein ACI8RZ_003564 [Myxococcota bacterium]
MLDANGKVQVMSTLKRTALPAFLLAALILPAAAQEAPRIPGHDLYAIDGARKEVDGAVTFAMIGNTRGSLRALDSRGAVSGVSQMLMTDIQSQVGQTDGPEFLVMMGDHVRGGSTLEWRRLDRRLSRLLAGTSLTEDVGLTSLPVAGDRERRGDDRLAHWGEAFPGVGVDIGYSRVASWYGFDIVSRGHTWRVLVLDTGKAKLGSRWGEQLDWLTEEAAGRFDSLLVLMHDPVLDLSTKPSNRDGAPLELMETIEEATSMRKIRGVFAAGSHANQALLPDGPLGSLYINAGGGGAPADDLRRWGAASDAGRSEDIHLEPMFDLSLLSAFNAWSDVHMIPESVMDEARASGNFEGFVGSLSSKHLPTYGWWKVVLDGEEASLLFRHRMPNGDIADRYQVSYTDADGWKGNSRP